MKDLARRRFLDVLAGARVVVAAGGAAAFMSNPRDPAAYDDAIEPTWRHSDSFELPLPAAQKELVRYPRGRYRHEPEILILDEPTSGVDPLARDRFGEAPIDLSRGHNDDFRLDPIS